MSDDDRKKRDATGDPAPDTAHPVDEDARRRTAEAAKAKASGKPAPLEAAGDHEHRLRTTKFADDFEDAESDSSAATIHRDDKVSES